MQRLLHESDSELEQQLLRAGREVELSSAAQARLLSVLGIGAGVTVASKAAASTGILSKLLGTKGGLVAASAVSVGVIGAGVYFAQSEFSGQRPPPAELEAPQVQLGARAPAADDVPAPSAEDVSGMQGGVEREAADEAQGSPGATEPPSRAASRRAARAPAPATGDGLGEELALVEAASRASKSGNPRLALQRLGEYRSKFPRGKLALEAQVLRVEAMSQAGQREQAAQLAKGILKRYPNSPVVARIRRYAD